MTSTRNTKTLMGMMVMMMVMMMATTENKVNFCSLCNVPYMKNLDPKSIEGTWYPVYDTYIHSHDFSRFWREIQYKEFNDKYDGFSRYIITNNGGMLNDGTCVSGGSHVFHADTEGILKGSHGYWRDAVITHNIFILGLSDNVMVVYVEFTLDGQLAEEFGSLEISVRNVSTPVVLTPQIKHRLRRFCGKAARKLDFFLTHDQDPNATCNDEA